MPLLSKPASSVDPSRIINIGSIDGINNPEFKNFSYSAAKSAVHHMTRVLASELVSRHINVNAIAPVDFLDSGLVDTSTANIASTGTTVVSSLAAACTEIEIQEDIG